MSRRLLVIRGAGFSRSRLVSRRVKPSNRVAALDSLDGQVRLVRVPLTGRRAATRVLVGLDGPPFGEPPSQSVPFHGARSVA
jgi:hypothetical protein